MQNPHPLFVHYPIAFLTVAAVATFLGVLFRRPNLRAFGRLCLFIGTAFAGIAVLTGFLAEQGVAPVSRAAESMVEHRTFGYGILVVAGVLCILGLLERRFEARAAMLNPVLLIGHAALLALLVLGAREGGELVHEFGVGTSMTAPGGPLHEPDAPAAVPGAAPDAPAPSGKDFR